MHRLGREVKNVRKQWGILRMTPGLYGIVQTHACLTAVNFKCGTKENRKMKTAVRKSLLS